ncbi:MAG: diaminopimelate decarboxylase family protein [Promethearchaeota archaeon]|jgi:diaminopimelate decarboxylase
MNFLSGNPYIIKKDQKIVIDLIPLDEIIENYTTPLLIFLKKRIKDNIKTFDKIFREEFEEFEFFYSLKANYLSAICEVVSSEKIGAEVVGLPELKVALNSGFLPENVIVGGPYLPEALIEFSIKNEIKEIILYNIGDIEKINEVANKFTRVQNVCLRINSGKFESRMGTKLGKSTLQLLKKALSKCKNIKLTSILSHFGSQMNNIDQYERHVKLVIDNLKLLIKNNINVENINFGGGFPEATVMPQTQLKKIARMVKTHLRESKIPYKKIMFEPGRYLVGDSGLFLAKIVNVTEDRWVFLDVGNHICPKFARCSLRFYNATQINEPHKFKTSIAGIVPTDQDVLVKNYFFTKNLNKEDKVLITNTGAYCLTFSNRFPYPLPEIVLIEGNEIITIFDPQKEKDFSIC